MNIKVIVCILLFPILSVWGQHREGSIKIIVRGFQSTKGNLHIGLFDSTNHFGIRYTKGAYKNKIVPVQEDGVTVVFDSIKPGAYSIAIYQDENLNGKFEYWNEDYALSKEGSILYRTPSFRMSKFHYDGSNQVLTMYLENELGRKVSKTTTTALAPILALAPETNWQFGASLIRLFKFRPDTVTRTSYFDYFGIVTTKGQVALKGNYIIFTPKEKYVLTGSNWIQYFPQFYYGIGNSLPDSNLQLVSYSQFKLDILVQRHIGKNLFAGVGYRYSNIFNLKSDPSKVLNTDPAAYGKHGSEVSGFQFALTADSRDNIYYPVRGHFIRAKSAHHFSQIGSQFNFSIVETEFRKYWRMSRNKWDVFAIQAYGYFSMGQVPWSELGILGNGDLMRGYYSGRYRDKDYIAVQAEYRLRINKLFGWVFFAGTGEVSDELAHFTADGLKPNGGTGVRLKIDRQERLNIRFDMGVGKNGANFYLSASEAF